MRHDYGVPVVREDLVERGVSLGKPNFSFLCFLVRNLYFLEDRHTVGVFNRDKFLLSVSIFSQLHFGLHVIVYRRDVIRERGAIKDKNLCTWTYLIELTFKLSDYVFRYAVDNFVGKPHSAKLQTCRLHCQRFARAYTVCIKNRLLVDSSPYCVSLMHSRRHVGSGIKPRECEKRSVIVTRHNGIELVVVRLPYALLNFRRFQNPFFKFFVDVLYYGLRFNFCRRSSFSDRFGIVILDLEVRTFNLARVQYLTNNSIDPYVVSVIIGYSCYFVFLVRLG